jgi:hypothetical protein
MKLHGLLLAFALTGCSTTVPVVAKFPDAPLSLKASCPELKKIEGDTISIVDLHRVVVENYTEYYACAQKVEGWNEWHIKQKKIFDEVK